MDAADARAELLSCADPAKREVLQRFFKTGPGQYGEGDRFAGIPVPVTRDVAKRFRTLPVGEVERLLADEIHECRLLGLLILVEQYRKADEAARRAVFDCYIAHTDRINNWDLVDLSAYPVVGRHLEAGNKELLYRFARNGTVWEQRIAIVSTWEYIRKGRFDDTIRLAEILLRHEHDLIRKAVGWMLREVGKRDEAVLLRFLDRYAREMPRTMLRYAIERLSPEQRAGYMRR